MLKPLNGYILLEINTSENKTTSGIFLSTSNKEKSQIATVIAIGEGKIVDGKIKNIPLKVDDQVVYKKYAGNELEYDNKKLIIVEENDILAIIEK